MSWLLILLVLIVILLLAGLVVFRLILKSFKNKQHKHRQEPSGIDIAYEEINIPTKNKCNLYGWLVKSSPSQPTLILVHGWGRNVERVLPYIEHLQGSGFNLLAFDSRHHGSSDDDEYSTMVKFAEEIISSVDFVIANKYFSSHLIGVVGLSIGGAASIYAAAHDKRIISVVTVGAFADPFVIMKGQLKNHHIPYYPIGWSAMRYLESRVGFSFADVAPVKHIGISDARFFIIHGEEDETISVNDFHRLTEASRDGQASGWLIPGKGHSDCHLEEGFWKKIREHFNTTLKE